MNLMQNVERISDALTDIKNAIVAKGVTPSGNCETYADAVRAIPQEGGTGTDVSDTTLTPDKALAEYVFHVADGSLAEGTIQSLGAQTITPGTTEQTIEQGKYLSGAQTILGDANLLAENIKKDVPIFGVIGTYEGSGGGGVQMASGVVSKAYKTSFNIDLPFEADLFIGQYRNASGALLGTVSLQRLNESELINQWSFWTSSRNSGATESNHKYTAGNYNDAISDYVETDYKYITRITVSTATSSASYGSGTMEWFAFKW